MQILVRLIMIVVGLALIPLAAIATAATKQRLADGPNLVFSGGPLVAGQMYRGPEPDWRFVNSIPTIELQLVEPPRSRRVWTVEHEGRLYVWSGYMGTTIGKLWKRWPVQAQRNGAVVLRIDGNRYRRELLRIQSGEELDGIVQAITAKYPSRTTRAGIEAGDMWLFEAAPPRR